ncbi:helix-turn-helix transcriptional regulator [Halomonas sp. GXIMD04776]|uniref:helix-turn-helix transcriptional regulator n=1 Tax=Halomonas sp. GXIMD04776 TaxID=3415605 RepID=UPI003C9E3E8E
MAIPNTAGMQRKPTHPGETLREDFIPDYDLTSTRLAEPLGVSRQSLRELLRCKTPDDRSSHRHRAVSVLLTRRSLFN